MAKTSNWGMFLAFCHHGYGCIRDQLHLSLSAICLVLVLAWSPFWLFYFDNLFHVNCWFFSLPFRLHFLIVGYKYMILSCFDTLHFNQLFSYKLFTYFWPYVFFTMFYLFCKPITVLHMSSSSSLEASYQQKVCPLLLSHRAFMDLAHLYFYIVFGLALATS